MTDTTTIKATCTLRAEDVQAFRPSWSLKKCEDWLLDNIKALEEGMSEDGMERIEFWLDFDDEVNPRPVKRGIVP